MRPIEKSPRVLLAGVGRWGSNHLRAWQKLGVDLYVAEPAASQRETCRSAGVADDHLFADFAQALDLVELVDVVTPVDSHYPIAMTALEAGKDVLVEKPLASICREAEELHDRAIALGRILQVGHIFRYDPATDFMRAVIACGELGQIRWLQARFAGFKRPRNDCGVTAADALHFIDLFNFLLGQSPLAVVACQADLLGRGMDDMSWVGLEYEQAIGTIEANYFTPEKDRRVVVVGDTATLVCDFTASDNRVTVYHNHHVPEAGGWKAIEGSVTRPEIGRAEPLARELAAFLQSCQTRQTPLADGRSGYEVVRVIEAAQQSAETGQAILLEERKPHATRAVVQGVHIRRDQAEGPRGHRLRTIHPRAQLHRV
ncbi:MAG: Gfo/Idh/MocA family oxidoreductase [Planctomycetes bacterium]|nr:Gfo/Idh/MocA family oxidoreductase [Planctomycetota bacterium]